MQSLVRFVSRGSRRGLAVLAAFFFCVTSFLACAVGVGEGTVAGTVRVPLCMINGAYDLHPSFFAGLRDGATLTIRIQDGGGPPDFTDNLVIRVDDVHEVARLLAASTEVDDQGRRVVTLPVGIQGSAGVLVHALFSPTRTCGRTKITRLGQNVGLWAYAGTMTFRSIDLGEEQDPTATGTREDTLTDVAAFDLRLHDPRPIGTPHPSYVSAMDPVGEAHLQGRFRFYYQRSVPAQPFP